MSASVATLVFKSPLTGLYGECQITGGLGLELKFAGYDCIIVQGRAEKPVYITVANEKVEIRKAHSLWGEITGKTITEILEEIGDLDAKAICIDPAGERLVRFASVVNEVRSNQGRCGVGAVMGSKNLKAIVVRGTKEIRYSCSDEVLRLTKTLFDRIMEDSITDNYARYGTSTWFLRQNQLGILPTKNWQEGFFDGAPGLDGLKDMKTNSYYCPLCPIGCKKYRTLREEPLSNSLYTGPEYETLYSFSSNCAIDTLKPILGANMLCNNLGLDPVSTGAVIAFAMECYERNLLSQEDTDEQLEFGNSEAMLTLIGKIAMKEGLGGILSDGVREASRRLAQESERFAMHVKGLEMSWGDPRGAKGLGLGFAVADRGLPPLRHTYLK